MKFAAEWADFNFCLGEGVNTPTACTGTIGRLVKAVAQTGRKVGAYALFMVIADETDEAAQAKWESYKAGKDMDALKWLGDQAGADDKATAGSTAKSMVNPVSAVNLNMGTFVGSYATVASMMDELEGIEGLAGVMLTFDDFILGMQDFGERIQPLMKSRASVAGV
jgi:pyrimidine oxygenase